MGRKRGIIIQKKIDYNRRNKMPQEQYTPIPQQGQAQPVCIFKRIGSTTYRVTVHFNPTSHETLGDKILRMAKSEVMEE